MNRIDVVSPRTVLDRLLLRELAHHQERDEEWERQEEVGDRIRMSSNLPP